MKTIALLTAQFEIKELANILEITSQHSDSVHVPQADPVVKWSSNPIPKYVPDSFSADDNASPDDKTVPGLPAVSYQNLDMVFGSFVLIPPMHRNRATRKELLAIIKLTQHFPHYLVAQYLVCRTDRGGLTWLAHFKRPQSPSWLLCRKGNSMPVPISTGCTVLHR